MLNLTGCTLSVLTFLEDTDRYCTHVWYHFLSVGTSTVRIHSKGRDKRVPAHVATTEQFSAPEFRDALKLLVHMS